MQTFAIGRFVAQGEPFTGVVSDGRVGRLTELLPEWNESGVAGLFDDWDANIEQIDSALSGGVALPWVEADLARLAPVDPRQLFCAGMNYRKHVVDLMVDNDMASRDEAVAVMD